MALRFEAILVRQHGADLRSQKAWAAEPERFRHDPAHLTSGLNT